MQTSNSNDGNSGNDDNNNNTLRDNNDGGGGDGEDAQIFGQLQYYSNENNGNDISIWKRYHSSHRCHPCSPSRRFTSVPF